MTQVSKQISVRILLPVILTCVASAIFAADQPTADLKSLYEGHHWFQLRDAIGKAEALPLYRGAVAAAFDQREEAEQYLGRVIAAAPASQKAAEARDILIAMQVRAGRYTQAAMNMTEQMESSSGKTAAHESGGMYDAIAKLPDMTVSYHGSPAQQYEMSDDRLSVPIVINGMRADFLLDTDSDISVISESEATRLGLPVTAGKVRVSGEAGDQENGGRIVVAKNLVTGNIEFNNVAFIVVPDGQEPFVELPAGKRGILGLPVLLGFRTLRWRPGGPIEIGFASAKEDLSRANLCFDKDDPVTL
ncbi:MAG TPA: retropepsin-like aspartic protease, partial [Candidatus Acidoferrum sp.]|nr:retropepsin-like aspartic protease [Candidatus Acidoferrum sp.]